MTTQLEYANVDNIFHLVIKIVMGLSKTCFAVFHNFDDIPSNPNLD